MSSGQGGMSPASVEKYIKGIDFPANKQKLVEQAKTNGAPNEVINTLQQLPGDKFNSPADIAKAYGQMR